MLPLLSRRSPALPVLRLQPEAVVEAVAVEALSEGAGEAALAGAVADILAAAEWQAGAMPVVAGLAGTPAAVEAGISVTVAAARVAGTSGSVTALSERAALHRR